jgi:hypothetical protein
VWVGGPDFLEGVLITDLNFADTDTAASGKMQIVRSKGRDENNYNAPHLETKDEFVVLYNRDISFSAASGSYVIAMEINYEWRPIWSQCNPVAKNTNQID